MRSYIARGKKGQIYSVMGTLGARQHYEYNKDIFTKYTPYLILFYFISPVFFLTTLFFLLYRYRVEIHKVYFKNAEVENKYKEFFTPMVSPEMFSAVGYRVYPEELNEHLFLINSDTKEDKKALGKKAQKMRRISTRQFGFNVDKLTRHIFYVGTTGSGKSETIMSFFTDVIRNAGGIGFIDGKGAIDMEGRIYNLCKEEYYETQFYVVNFTSPEESPDSNTYSPLLSYPSAMKAGEFLGEYIGGGDGNADYFANRGKVMMGNVIRHYKSRQYHYGENFSFSDIAQGRNHLEMSNIYALSYGVCLEIEEIIKQRTEDSVKFKSFMNKARGLKIPALDEIENLELLHEYLSQNASSIYLIEKELGLDFEFISNYFMLYSLILDYIKGISASWAKYTLAISQAVYSVAKANNQNFLYTKTNPIKMRTIREYYIAFKREQAEHQVAVAAFGDKKDVISNFNEALGLVEGSKEHLEKLEASAMQQHGYAIQQWDRVFDLFTAYRKIMGVVYPDIDGEDIIKNNKVLFVLLPATELSKDLVEALGKLIILMFKNIASIALGGSKQASTSVQFKIYQHKIMPTPIFMMVTDEIGSYMPSNGMSLIASQVRSLRIALIIAGQDVVSVEPNGADGKRERARLMANLAKIVLQTRDMDTADLERLVPDVEVLESDSMLKSATTHEYINNPNYNVKKVKMFDIGIATKFAKGFGMYLDGARDEPIYFQSYYLGDNIRQALQIRKRNSFINVYKEYELSA